MKNRRKYLGLLLIFEFGGTIEGDKEAIYHSEEKILSFIQKYDAQ